MTEFPRLRAVSDCAVLTEFGEDLADPAHRAVLALDRVLAADPVTGQVEVVPAYVSVMVVFDPVKADHASVMTELRGRIGRDASGAGQPREHRIDVVYDGPDLDEVAQRTGLAVDEVIAAHLAGRYRVFLYGFAPGYAYLGGVPAALRLPRKDRPVRDVPAGSVIIAGQQCIITTLTMPTGWWVIGRSEVRILRPDGLLFNVGDRVCFERTAL